MTRNRLGRVGSKAKPSATQYLSYTLGASIPMILGLYWFAYRFHPFAAARITRPAVIAISALLALLFAGLRVSKEEIRLSGVLGVVCLIYLANAFTAVDVDRALEGWIKQLILCLIALFIARALRNPSVAKGFGQGLILACVLIAGGILFTYFRLMGLAIPTYASTRLFKGMVEHGRIPLNPVAFTGVMAYMVAMCLVRTNSFLLFIGFTIFVVCSFFTGSRAPLAVLLVSGLLLFIIDGVRSARMARRFTAFVVLIALLIGTPIVLQQTSFKKMSDLTEGRWDFWSVAVQKFSERPFVGYGFESAHDDLLARTPGVYSYKGEKTQGGYHNIYLTVLAEEGLSGFAALLVLLWFMIRSSWLLAFRKWQTWHNGRWALAAALFLVVRAGIESSGLLGYLNGPSDYIAYIFLGVLASRFSIEETCARDLLNRERAGAAGVGSTLGRGPSPLRPVFGPQLEVF